MSATREQQIEGLRLLADFLERHPDVPVPAIDRIVLHRPANVVDFLDGLAEVPVTEKGAWTGVDGVRTYVDLVRRFAGLDLVALTDADHVGAVVEVPSTTIEFLPFSPDRIRAALAPVTEGAENGTAGTAPSVNLQRGAA